MGWFARAAGTGALVAAVCAAPGAVARFADAAARADATPDADSAPDAADRELSRQLDGVRALLARELPGEPLHAYVDTDGVAVVATASALSPRLQRAVAVLLPAGTPVAYRAVRAS